MKKYPGRQVECFCAICGNSYKARLTDIMRGYGLTCSRSCGARARMRKRDQTGSNNPFWKGGLPPDPVKKKAGTALRYAVNSGKLTRLPCVKCGTEPAQGHHKDYSKPLDVIWLCRKHHEEEHHTHKMA